MKYTKIRNVKSPEVGTGMSAGIDLFIPIIDSKFIEKFKELNPQLFSNFFKRQIMIASLEKGLIPVINMIKIPTGIKFNFLNDVPSALIAKDKSGMSTKHGYSYLGGVIDQDYQGEVIIAIYITNSDKRPGFFFHENDKFIQLLHMPIVRPVLEEVSTDSLYISGMDEIVTERGEGGFGSTNKEVIEDLKKNKSSLKKKKNE